MISTSTAIGVISVGTNLAAYATPSPVNWLLLASAVALGGIAEFAARRKIRPLAS
jgi:hypothetical protein